MSHCCLRLLLGNNSPFRWELGNGDAMVRIDVPGNCTISDTQTTIEAATDGLGLAYVLRRRAEAELRDGRLEVVMPNGPRWAQASTCTISQPPAKPPGAAPDDRTDPSPRGAVAAVALKSDARGREDKGAVALALGLS